MVAAGLIPLLAIAATFVLTAALLAVVRANPFTAFYAMLVEPLSAPVSALEVLVKATPLILTGLAVLFAFRGGYYNIGAEGQLYAGALAAAWIGQLPLASALPSPVVIGLMLLGSFAAGHAVGAGAGAAAHAAERGRGGDHAAAQRGDAVPDQRHPAGAMAGPGD